MRIHSSCIVTDRDIIGNDKHEIERRIMDELAQHLAQQIVRLVHKETERITNGPTFDDPLGHSTRFHVELEISPCRRDQITGAWVEAGNNAAEDMRARREEMMREMMRSTHNPYPNRTSLPSDAIAVERMREAARTMDEIVQNPYSTDHDRMRAVSERMRLENQISQAISAPATITPEDIEAMTRNIAVPPPASPFTQEFMVPLDSVDEDDENSPF